MLVHTTRLLVALQTYTEALEALSLLEKLYLIGQIVFLDVGRSEYDNTCGFW